MRSISESQWNRCCQLIERLENLPGVKQKELLLSMRAQGEDRDILSLVELHFRLPPELERCRTDEQIGRCILHERISYGGMGEVYRATQVFFTKNSGREVALKLIHPALLLNEQNEAVGRFEEEVNALLKLEHEGIVRIYEGGVDAKQDTSETIPFFAMQLINQGIPLTSYAKKHSLSILERINLFISICNAVSYAHHRQIIHRDLKPNNILVDSSGYPFVIDFGLAQVCDLSNQQGRWKSISGTPPYMSPEQISDGLGPVTQVSDVYSLGVVLFELLAQRLPYELSLNIPFKEIRKIILNSEPLKLGNFCKESCTDLEKIVMKALEKNPSNRYNSVEAIRDDISQYIKNNKSRILYQQKSNMNSMVSSRDKTMEFYMVLMACGAYLLANLPLIFTVKEYYHDRTVLFRLLMHNPNQYLFLAFFFLVVVVSVSWTGIRLNIYIQSIQQSIKVNKWWKRRFYVMLSITVPVGLFITYSTVAVDYPDFPGLRNKYAQRAVHAHHLVLSSMTNSPPGTSTKEDLKELSEWEDNLSDKKMKDVIPIMNKRTYNSLNNTPPDGLRDILDSDIDEVSQKLHKAIPYLQVLLGQQYLDKLRANFPNLNLINWSIIITNIIELFAVLVVIGHSVIFLVVILLIKHSFFKGSQLSAEMIKIVYILYTAITIISIWIGLRIIAFQEVKLVYGGLSHGAINIILAVGIFVIAFTIYLLYGIGSVKVTKQIFVANLIPLAGGIGITIGALYDPLFVSRNLGSLSDPRSTFLLIFAYAVILIIWIITMGIIKQKSEIL